MLGEGLNVGDRLTRVLDVGEQVHHRDGHDLGDLLEVGMVEDPHPEKIEIPLEHPADVLGSFPGAKADLFVADDHRVYSQLDRSHVAGHPGPHGLLHEEQADRPPGQSPGN